MFKLMQLWVARVNKISIFPDETIPAVGHLFGGISPTDALWTCYILKYVICLSLEGMSIVFFL